MTVHYTAKSKKISPEILPKTYYLIEASPFL